MKTRALLLTVVLAFGSLAASRVLDDDALLQDPDRYTPYPKQDRMVQLTVKKSGVTFCIYQGEWKPLKDGLCTREETSIERVNRLMEKARQTKIDQDRMERLRKMSRKDHFQFNEKRRRELLGGPRFQTRWEIVSTH